MGALPNRLPGFQDCSRTTPCARASRRRGASTIPPRHGKHLTEMFEAMEHGDAARGLRDRREPGAVRGRPDSAPCGCSTGLDHLVVQDIFLTKTARARRRRPPRRVDAGRGGGHRHLERAPRAARAQGARPAGRGARRRRDRLRARARGSATTSAARARRTSGTSCARSRPMHAGMSYARLEELGGIQWPCCGRERSRRAVFLHGRLWDDVVEEPRAVPAGRALDRRSTCSTTTSRCA